MKKPESSIQRSRRYSKECEEQPLIYPLIFLLLGPGPPGAFVFLGLFVFLGALVFLGDFVFLGALVFFGALVLLFASPLRYRLPSKTVSDELVTAERDEVAQKANTSKRS